MKTIKTLLTIKTISDVSDLDYGEIAIFEDKLYFRNYSGDLSTVDFFNENKYVIVIIYGLRVSVVNDKDNIERVLIERRIYEDGRVIDIEKIGDESGLDFKAENHVFYNGLFDDLEPFKSMEEVSTACTNELQYNYNGKFVKLPIFFKNKEKTKTIDGVMFDYYLISPICFDDFYPVESHKKDTGYVDCIFLESDWRQHEGDHYISPEDMPIDGGWDGLWAVFMMNNLINDVILYCYLYYIYFIKTANFKPFSDISPQKKSVFIVGAGGFENFDGYDDSMLTHLYNLNGGNSSDLSDVLTQEEIQKYPWYLKLTNGKNDNTFFENIFFEDCIYNINGYVNNGTSASSYIDLVSLVAQPKFLPQKQQGCVFFLVSELMELQHLDSGEDAFRANRRIVSNSSNPYVIKLIPFFYDQTNVYGNGFIRSDELIENNTYTDSGNFCIDHLRNLLPVFYNAYMPFDKNNPYNDYISTEGRKKIIENYNVVINSGSADGYPQNMSYKKSICFCSPTEINIPYCNKNHVYYSNLNSEFNRQSVSIATQISLRDNLKFVIVKYRDGTDFIVRSYATSLGKTDISNAISESCLCYEYKCVSFFGYQGDFNWGAITIAPLMQQYENYDYTYDGVKIGNCYFVSRMFYYPYKYPYK
jgi:hypothetical protein